MNILEARRRTLGGRILKKTVTGNPAVAVGGLARRGPGITMQGWTEQDGTPTPEAPVPIVSAGTKNQDTGKWEYEITITNAQTDPDKNQTVTLTADRPLTKWDKLEKRNGQWGWVYKSAEVVFDGSEKWSLYSNANVGTLFYTNLPNASSGFQTSLCDKYRNVKRIWDASYDGTLGIYGDHSIQSDKYFRPPSAAVETVAQWKAWLSENPLTLWYETEVETFVPLSESEQEAMNALHTYRPTTVLSNQQDCEMVLTYKTRKGVGGGNPYGLEIGGIAGGGGGYEFEATNRIRTDYIPFYSPDGSRTYTIVGNPYNIANSNAYDNQKNALGSYEMTAGAFTPPAGTWFIRISFSKPDNSDFTQEELNQLIRTFDIERSC